MRKFKRLSLILTALLVLVSISACQPDEVPEENDENQVPQKVEEREDVEIPSIPDSINQGDKTEPILNVYLMDGKRVEEMKFEDYVSGVLAGEMNNEFPEQALEAQAILARTFVMEFITDKGQSQYEGAHVSTDIQEAQAWNAEEINERIINAVANTRGQVLVHNGEYVKAWFHSHAGGMTASAEEGLEFEDGEPAYIQPVESTESEQAPEEDANWTATFSKGEIQAAMSQLGNNTADFTSIEIVNEGPSGRATELKIGEETVSAPRFRNALGSRKMKSTNIESISLEGDTVTISGIGYGHGVGLSQWGAYQMAEDGKSAEDIINHYFQDINLVTLWE